MGGPGEGEGRAAGGGVSGINWIFVISPAVFLCSFSFSFASISLAVIIILFYLSALRHYLCFRALVTLPSSWVFTCLVFLFSLLSFSDLVRQFSVVFHDGERQDSCFR